MTGLFSKKSGLKEKFRAIFNRSAPDADFWSELEKTLIEADAGVELTAKLIESVRKGSSTDEVKKLLAEKMAELLSVERKIAAGKPHVILVVGINGVGKTTTIAKLAHSYKKAGKKVLLVAADTFRAAAVEQLLIWGERLDMEVVSQGANADAAAVAFDGVSKAIAKNYDVAIVDTAGRLHTKKNLMDELKKVARVIGKVLPNAPHERVLVLDATVGRNGLSQVREFDEALSVTGVILAKLDGTAKGGAVLGISGELKVPVTHAGLGEAIEDLRPFNPREFVNSILDF